MKIKYSQLPNYIGKQAIITGPMGWTPGKKVRIVKDYQCVISDDPENIYIGMPMPIFWNDIIEIMGD
jgi:hypothetical protein